MNQAGGRMPVAATSRRLGRVARWAGPLAVVALAVGAAVVTGSDEDSEPPPAEAPGEELVEVESDALRLGSLDELVAASDVVITGEVAGTERGRTFGQPGGATIESRLVTLTVDEVVAGTAPRATTVLVEEEGWLDDGRALVVDGARPSEAGDRGVWFLVEVDDPDLPVYTVVSAEGRYLTDPEGTLAGADNDDPLIAEVESLGLDGLLAAVRA
jgi:hypothetical protein